jgi:hypothetical protein
MVVQKRCLISPVIVSTRDLHIPNISPIPIRRLVPPAGTPQAVSQ